MGAGPPKVFHVHGSPLLLSVASGTKLPTDWPPMQLHAPTPIHSHSFHGASLVHQTLTKHALSAQLKQSAYVQQNKMSKKTYSARHSKHTRPR